MSFMQSCPGFPDDCPNLIDVSTVGTLPEEPEVLCGCTSPERWAQWLSQAGGGLASTEGPLKAAGESFHAMAERFKKPGS